eukprot:gene2569-3784_t
MRREALLRAATAVALWKRACPAADDTSVAMLSNAALSRNNVEHALPNRSWHGPGAELDRQFRSVWIQSPAAQWDRGTVQPADGTDGRGCSDDAAWALVFGDPPQRRTTPEGRFAGCAWIADGLRRPRKSQRPFKSPEEWGRGVCGLNGTRGRSAAAACPRTCGVCRDAEWEASANASQKKKQDGDGRSTELAGARELRVARTAADAIRMFAERVPRWHRAWDTAARKGTLGSMQLVQRHCGYRLDTAATDWILRLPTGYCGYRLDTAATDWIL